MDLYGRLVRDVLYPGLEAVRGRPTVGFMRYLERMQWASAEELTAIQSGLVRRLAQRVLRRADVRTAAELAAHVEVTRDARPPAPNAWTEASTWRFHEWAGYRRGMKVFYEDGEPGGLERVVGRGEAEVVVGGGAVNGLRRIDVVAAECDARDGLHVAVELAVVEVVDGELVVTDLQDVQTPRVRCAIGVRARAKPAARCACGRWLPRVEVLP